MTTMQRDRMARRTTGASWSLSEWAVGSSLLLLALAISAVHSALPVRIRERLIETLWMVVLGWRVTLVWAPAMRRKGVRDPLSRVANRPPEDALGNAFGVTAAHDEPLEAVSA